MQRHAEIDWMPVLFWLMMVLLRVLFPILATRGLEETIHQPWSEWRRLVAQHGAVSNHLPIIISSGKAVFPGLRSQTRWAIPKRPSWPKMTIGQPTTNKSFRSSPNSAEVGLEMTVLERIGRWRFTGFAGWGFTSRYFPLLAFGEQRDSEPELKRLTTHSSTDMLIPIDRRSKPLRLDGRQNVLILSMFFLNSDCFFEIDFFIVWNQWYLFWFIRTVIKSPTCSKNIRESARSRWMLNSKEAWVYPAVCWSWRGL